MSAADDGATADALRAVTEARARVEVEFRRRTPRSGARFAAACGPLPGGNTRSNLHLDPYPLVVERAAANELVDVDGNVYADLNNDYTVAVLGHAHPRIAEVVHEQLARGMSWGARSDAETVLAEALRQRFPVAEQLRFVNSGTEANLLAVLTALDATGRDLVLGFDGGYHGSVLSFVPERPRLNVPVPTVVVPYNDVAALDAAFAEHGPRLAAAVVELMLNSGGCIPAEPGFLAALRRNCDEHGTLLIADEVMTARLGAGGLLGRTGLRADLVTLGKFIGGGFPIGAFGGSAELMAVFDVRRPGAVAHGGSFNNEVFSMHAGAVALTELATGAVLERLSAEGDELRHRLGAVLADHGVPLVLTGIGSTMAVHLGDEAPRAHERDPLTDAVRRLLHLDLLVRGWWVAGRAMLATSLATTPAQLDGLVAAFAAFARDHGDVVRLAAAARPESVGSRPSPASASASASPVIVAGSAR